MDRGAAAGLMLSTKISTVLDQLDVHVRDDPAGDFQHGMRLLLWDAMDAQFGQQGRCRRAVLSYLVASDLLPIWHGLQLPSNHRELPDALLALSKAIILHRITEHEAKSKLDSLSWLAEDMESQHLAGLGACAFCIGAARAACSCALRDETRYETWGYGLRNEDLDSDLADTHLLASWVVANGAAWEDQSDHERRRGFWHRWIHDRVPMVSGEFNEVLGLV